MKKSNIQNDKSISETPNKQNYHSDKIISSDILTQQFNFGYNKALEEVEKMIKNRIDIMEQLKKINEKPYQEVVLKELYFIMDKLKQLEKKE